VANEIATLSLQLGKTAARMAGIMANSGSPDVGVSFKVLAILAELGLDVCNRPDGRLVTIDTNVRTLHLAQGQSTRGRQVGRHRHG
jgi:hypothetical protein